MLQMARKVRAREAPYNKIQGKRRRDPENTTLRRKSKNGGKRIGKSAPSVGTWIRIFFALDPKLVPKPEV
jgi:hypothetical protein